MIPIGNRLTVFINYTYTGLDRQVYVFICYILYFVLRLHTKMSSYFAVSFCIMQSVGLGSTQLTIMHDCVPRQILCNASSDLSWNKSGRGGRGSYYPSSTYMYISIGAYPVKKSKGGLFKSKYIGTLPLQMFILSFVRSKVGGSIIFVVCLV